MSVKEELKINNLLSGSAFVTALIVAAIIIWPFDLASILASLLYFVLAGFSFRMWRKTRNKIFASHALRRLKGYTD